MRDSFPFTDYDFWAYISAGFAFLFVGDHVLNLELMVRSSWTLVEGIFAMACAYAIGHLIAGLASALLEKRLVRRWLGIPTQSLFGVKVGPSLFRLLYPSYYEALPPTLQSKALAKAAQAGISEPGEALFYIAYDAAKKSPTAMVRLSGFLNQYGLCRNLSFTALLATLTLAASAYWRGRQEDYWWSLASFALGIGMFLRYLKFYRHYAIEVFTTYAFSE